MKSKCSFILKASTALVLALLMLFGTVATSVAAVVDDLASTGWSTSTDGIAMSTKIYTGSGEVAAWSVSGLKNSDGYQDFDITTAGTYYYKVILDNKWYGNKSWSGYQAFDDTESTSTKYCSHRESDSDTGSNSSATFPAGQYVLKLDSHTNDNKAAYYYLYRKKASVDAGWNSGGWSNSAMTYLGDGAYEIIINGDGNQYRFRPKFVDGDTTYNYRPWGTGSTHKIDMRGYTTYDGSYSMTGLDSEGNANNYFYFDTVDGGEYHIKLKNGKVWLEYTEPTGYSLWGGDSTEFDSKGYLAPLTLNDATGLYDGSYTFNSTNWHSFVISASDSTSTFRTAWSSYSEVGWALDYYNNNTVYQGYSGNHKEEMADGLFTFVEITDRSSEYGIKLAARAVGTTVNLSYDPTAKILWIWGGTGSDKALIYAKDGCINEARDTSRVIGTTTVSGNDVSNISRQTISGKDDNNNSATITCYTSATATKGKDITVTTTISSTFASKYLVKGWDVNGDTYGIDPVAVGNDYSATFTVPDADKVEITPIYWLKNGDVTTFFVKDFNKVPSEWGGALYYYFWGGSQVTVDDEVRYPGQPFVHAGGQYYAQVPTDVTGITLNNAVWDTIHGQQIMGVGGSESSHHYQTYDFDNFAKIAAEYSDINSVYFSFKYETVKDNFGSSSGSGTASITLSNYGTSGNGWEEYKDPLGRPINILGGTTVTTGGKVLYAVSNGYVRNYQGNLATEWSIYVADSSSATTASYLTTIPSSALVLDAAADFDKSAYASNYTPSLNSYKSAWTTLSGDTYKNLPVYVTYEKAIDGGYSLITNGGTCPSGAGGQDSSHKDPAIRMDGKWDYIKNSDYSTANIIIEKSDNNGATYTTDAFSSSNTGTTTHATAFFNNTGAAYANTHEVTAAMEIPVSTTNKYKLKTVPDTSTGYQFVGWYRLDDGSETPELISKSTEAESLMSAKATFIARYKYVTAGNLIISHQADGEGVSTNHTLKAEIYAGDAVIGTDEPITSFEGTSVTLGNRYISSDSTYKIRVILTAKAETSTSYIDNSVVSNNVIPTVACSQSSSTYYASPDYEYSGRFTTSRYPQNLETTLGTFTIASLFSNNTQSFTVLSYTTTFNKLPTYTINYKYHGRESGSDYLTFARTITLSPDEAEGKDATGASYSGNNGTALRPTFNTPSGSTLVNDITANAPDTNDLSTTVFNKNITWSASAYTSTASPATVYATEGNPNYTLTYTYYEDDGTEHSAQTVTGAYNTLIRFGETSGTHVTASTKDGKRFAYWADSNNNPLTSSILYSMRLVDNVTIHPVYGSSASGWYSSIDKITRTHETSDSIDNVYTDFALRFSGFDANGSFIHINPDHLSDYTVGVAVVYDTAGNNTTATTEEIPNAPFYDLTKSSRYGNAQDMVQLLVTNNRTSARLSDISSTTYVTRYEATNSNLTNLNRIDLAVKYNYSQNYKRYYDAYAYIIDNSTHTVLEVSPIAKSGYLYDGKLPIGN